MKAIEEKIVEQLATMVETHKEEINQEVEKRYWYEIDKRVKRKLEELEEDYQRKIQEQIQREVRAV